MTIPRPPLDPELAKPLHERPEMAVQASAARIPAARRASHATPIDKLLEGRDIEHIVHRIPSFDGGLIELSVFRRSGHSDATAPAIFHVHGGGMIGGHRFIGAERFIEWIEEHGAVVATVDYRLAPENPDPAPVEDCYAALTWFADRADMFGFDGESLLVIGRSAGGGLAAGAVLLARDRQHPKVAWQMLCCPMLDDRDRTVSTHQIADGVPWARPSNQFAWSCLLGDRYGTDDVSIYAAPSRAENLSGLPPTFIDVGDAEVFRDESVEYASRIWQAGGNADLHVWSGVFHGSSRFSTARVSIAVEKTQQEWIRRQFRRLSRQASE